MKWFVMFLVANLLVCNIGFCDEFDDEYREALRKDGYIHISEVPTDSLINGLSDRHSPVPNLKPVLAQKEVSFVINNDAHTLEYQKPETSYSGLWFVVGLVAGGVGGYFAVKHWK